jgi:lipoprotein signal peptidase
MAANSNPSAGRRGPRQWPLGIFIAVVWVCWDLTAKLLLETRLVPGTEHRRELAAGLDLILSYDRPIWPIGSLLGSAVATVALLLMLIAVRRTLPAIGLSVGLGGFLGDLIDQWPDQELTHFLVFHHFGPTTLAFNFSEVGIGVCALIMVWEALAWAVRRAHRRAPAQD